MKKTDTSPPSHWVWQSLALAAIYFLTGKFCLLLAIPPGYATPVWPSAGIALAWVLVFGIRVWPGVFLGSFLINISTGMQTFTLAAFLEALPLPFGIGIGSILQAIGGAWLIRRWVGFPHAFDRPMDILKTMGIGGPVSSLISASVGITSLFVTGNVTTGEVFDSWWTWYLGDTVGVLIVLPVVSAWGMELQQAALRTRVLVGLPLAVGVILTIIIFLDIRAGEWHSAQKEFERRAHIMVQAINRSITSNLEIVQNVAALFSSIPQVAREEFHTFVDPIFLRHQGLHGLSWNPVVKQTQRAAYEEKAVQEGFPGFKINEQNGEGQHIEAGDRKEYVVVFYIEPYETNEKALGYDLASDPVRAQALAQARDTGTIQTTPPITLVQESGQQQGYLFFAPVYNSDYPPSTIEERRRTIHSYVSGVFRAGTMFEEALKTFAHQGIDYRVVDVTVPEIENYLYQKGKSPNRSKVFDEMNVPAFNGFRWETDLPIAGRRWAVVFWSNADYNTAELSGKPWAILTGGLFFTSLLGALLLAIAGRTAMVERMVVERTAELSASNQRLTKEIQERQQAERALQHEHEQLESRVEERTGDLIRANQELQAEMQRRKEAQAAYKRAEQDLLKKQKLDSIAVLAGGIAHDFNNLLTALSGNLALAKLEDNLSDKTRHFLNEAERALTRSTSLTHQLLTFAKGGAPVKKIVDLAELVKESCNFSLSGSNVKCEYYMENLSPAMIDTGQIDQVVGNLVRNAMQAMNKGGVLKVRAINVFIERGAEPVLQPGPYIKISFEDQGSGIPVEHRSKIFDPYFTTKPGGSGLGLATAYSIIRRHSGTITVESELGRGSIFHVFLPALPSDGFAPSSNSNAGLPLGHIRILVMDDEKMIRQVVEEYVAQLGYEAETVPDGDEAVRRYREELMAGRRFDAVVLDLTVPGGMGGKETIRHLLEIDPEIKAIVSSGYSEDPILSNFAQYGFSEVIAKPYGFTTLRETLQRLLNSHSPGKSE